MGTISIMALTAGGNGGGGGGGGSYGMPMIMVEGTEVDEAIPTGHALMCVDPVSDIAVELVIPDEGENMLEYMLTFVADDDCYLTVTADGMQLIYPDGTPTLTAGKLYEFSFVMDYPGDMVGLYKEIDINYE